MPVIPFALQCTIPEHKLLASKDSVKRRLNSAFVLNIPGFKYCVTVLPDGDDDSRGEVWIGLLLKLGNVKKVKVDHTYLIESANYFQKTSYTYEKTGAWKHSLADNEDFFKPEKKFIVDGKFTIKVCGTFEYETGDAPTSEQQKWEGGELGDKLWEENDRKDFTIFVDEKEIKVHKLLLHTRSDVFKAMFNSSMKESIENKVEITDFTFQVVETAVKMLYNCHFTSSLSLDELMSLLQFFDKYQIPSLKEKVELLLIDQISAATVCRFTNCSVFTNSIQLKNKCVELLMDSFASKTPLSDIEILDKDVLVKVFQNMMPIIPFAFKCAIREHELFALKDSENGLLNTASVSRIPGFEYYLSMNRNVERTGQIYIGIGLELGDVKTVESDFSIVTESANYSYKTQHTYVESICLGGVVCSIEEFFSPEKRFIVDGKCTVKVYGTFEFLSNDQKTTSKQQKWNGVEFGNELWEEDDDKNFTIVADGKEIKVHKIILKTRSDVFKAMFSSTMKETSENKVEITDFTFEVVEAAVKIMYNCHFTSSLSLDEMMSLLQFFDKYQIPSLKEKVELLLINQISAATVCRFTNCSIFTNSIQLKNKCMEFLEKSFASKLPLSDIEILDKDIIVEVVQNMVYETVEIR